MKRMKGMFLAFLLLLVLLAGRLYYVQVLCGAELFAAAQEQHLIPVLQANRRGQIYDRNMEPLTDLGSAYYYVLHRENLSEEAMSCLEEMDGQPAGERGEDYFIYRGEKFSSWANRILQEECGAYGFSVPQRFIDGQPALPLLTDLDEMYDDTLKSNGPAFYFLGNGAGAFVRGGGVMGEGETSVKDCRPAALITTIDLPLQRAVEQCFDRMNLEGSAMITDAATGQVLVMASRSENHQQVARDRPEDTPEAEQHGEKNLTVEEAYKAVPFLEKIRRFGRACNLSIEESGNALGFGQAVFKDYPGEAAGDISGQTSQKQKPLTATPAQISQMMVNIFNGENEMPLTLTMAQVPKKGISFPYATEASAEQIEKMVESWLQKPLTGFGWGAGFSGKGGRFVIVIHVEGGHEKSAFEELEAVVKLQADHIS